MTQSRIDSLMEAVVNILIGTAIYTLVNHTILAWMLGIPISVGTSLLVSAMFTVVSIARSYAIRRLFNGRSVWQSLRRASAGVVRFWQHPHHRPIWKIILLVPVAALYVVAESFTEWCDKRL